jgi:hypothetical protein
MPTPTKYTLSIASDFPGGAVNTTTLTTEIQASSIVTALDRIDTAGDVIDIWFKDALSAGDKTTLDNDATGPAGGLIAAHNNAATVQPPDPVSISNIKTDVQDQLIVANALGIDGGVRLITHNFCDPCSWWHHSTEHTAQATTSGDSLTYDITNHVNLIDITHGRLAFETFLSAATVGPVGNTMTNIIPTVLLDATPLAQSLEGHATDPDRYTIDYENGDIIFGVARTGEVVTASFRKAGSSKFCIVPSAGKKIVLQDAEVDVTENIDMTAHFHVDVHGSHTSVTGGNVVSLSDRVYKNMHDFQAAARRFWGPVPANFGITGGVNSPKWTFEWQYSRSDELYDTPNYRDLNINAALVTLNKVEVSIEGDVAFGGDFLTVTMYGYETAEST